MRKITASTFVVPNEVTRPRPARTQAPTFSVVIACYQGASTVGETLTSMLNQTMRPYEIIVCDDGSTDELDKALAPFRDNIIFLRQQNRGVAAARNLGLRTATGEFVVICDADDIYLPTRLSELANLAMFRPDLDILSTAFYIEVAGRIIGHARSGPGHFPVDDQRAGILQDNFVPGPSAFRREILKPGAGYDELLSSAEDWDFWMRLILDGARAGLVDAPLMQYRLRPGSLSSSNSRLRESDTIVLEKTLARTDLTGKEREDVTRRLKSSRRVLVLEEARDALEIGDKDVRRRCMRVVLGNGYQVPTRAKALFSALAPGFVRGHMTKDTSDERRVRYWTELIKRNEISNGSTSSRRTFMNEPIQRWARVSEFSYRLLGVRSRDITESTSHRSALIVAPHPDDETFGCAALILRKRAAGTRVAVCVVSDGGAFVNDVMDREQLIQFREKNLREACRRLGVPDDDLYLLGFPDAGLSNLIPEITQSLASTIANVGAEEIYIPSSLDNHPDHVAVHAASMGAVAQTKSKATLFTYPIWFWAKSTWALPNASFFRRKLALSGIIFETGLGLRPRKVRTDGFLDAKREVMDVYAFELEPDEGFFDIWHLRKEEFFFAARPNSRRRT